MNRNYFGTIFKNVPEFDIADSFWWDDWWGWDDPNFNDWNDDWSRVSYSRDKLSGLVNWEEEYPRHIKRGRLIDNILSRVERDNNLNTLSNFWPK